LTLDSANKNKKTVTADFMIKNYFWNWLFLQT